MNPYMDNLPNMGTNDTDPFTLEKIDDEPRLLFVSLLNVTCRKIIVSILSEHKQKNERASS